MPWPTLDSLPDEVKRNVPSRAGREIWQRVGNKALRDGKGEQRAFAAAWGALARAGYEQNAEGKYVKRSGEAQRALKTAPTAGDVHIDGDVASRRRRETEKDGEYELPESARNNARQVLEWREEHGDEVEGMTEVGWRRARQLANNKTVGAETVQAMAQFNRHRKNGKLDAEHEDEPWKDAGYVAWLGWGGDTGIDWAIQRSEAMEKVLKRMLSDDVATDPQEAMMRSAQIGLGGLIHLHEINGTAVYMPGRTHDEYLAHMEARIPQVQSSEGENFLPDETVYESSEDEENDTEANNGGRVARIIADVIQELSKGRSNVYAPVMKVDTEQRMAYGWANIISENGKPVVDLQGDVISSTELVSMAKRYMEGKRVAKAMHQGKGIGEVVFAFPMTAEFAKTFGVSVKSQREGLMIGMRVDDDEAWKRVKSGDLKMFSIGGKAVRNAV